MKSSIIEIAIKKPFDVTLGKLNANIIANGFMILHEINTTEILSRNGIKIEELRQVLFFHPSYMKDVLSIDYLLVNEVPLKFVIRSIKHNETSISILNPLESMKDYNGAEKLAVILLEKIMLILNFH